MLKFNFRDYATRLNDSVLGDVIQPTKKGVILILQYLNHKYQTNINLFVDGYTIDNDYLRPISTYLSTDHVEKINAVIAESRNKPGDYRETCFLSKGSGTDQHVVLIAYIKEGDEEGFFLNDSLGSRMDVPQKIYSTTGIHTFYTNEQSQADDYSCYVGAIVLARDITQIDSETRQYKIPNLLCLLKERSKELKEGVSSVKLPNALLKTTQLNSFFLFNKDTSRLVQKIHKKETIDEFRRRYSVCFR